MPFTNQVYYAVFRVLLIVGGCWWCWRVFRRRRNDIADFKETDDNVHRLAIIFIWLVTLGIACWVVSLVVAAFGPALRALH